MSVAAIKKELMKMPELPRLISELASALEDERQRRQNFYKWVDENKKVEFINGEIIEHSPVADEHSTTFNYLSRSVTIHVDFNDLGGVRLEKAMVSLTRNDYEPDLCFWLKNMADLFKVGQTHYPAPNWVCEILSKGTEERDRTTKFDDYALHGVYEYWIVDPRLKTIEQYLLDEETDSYFLFKKLGVGDTIESKVIKGFKIPVLAIFDKEANNNAIADLIQKK
jgi:Uma2 family endonuclease